MLYENCFKCASIIHYFFGDYTRTVVTVLNALNEIVNSLCYA